MFRFIFFFRMGENIAIDSVSARHQLTHTDKAMTGDRLRLSVYHCSLSQTSYCQCTDSGCVSQIVGRPNVGKSTLVNGLIRDPDRCLTGSQPGLTRDSVTVQLQYHGRAVDFDPLCLSLILTRYATQIT
jgi:predicted GTPase